MFIMCEITNFNGTVVEVLERIGDFTPNSMGMWLLIHAGIKVIHFSKRVPRDQTCADGKRYDFGKTALRLPPLQWRHVSIMVSQITDIHEFIKILSHQQKCPNGEINWLAQEDMVVISKG